MPILDFAELMAEAMTNGETPARYAWQTLEDHNGGILWATLKPDGDMVVQFLHHVDKGCSLNLPASCFPILRDLLSMAPAPVCPTALPETRTLLTVVQTALDGAHYIYDARTHGSDTYTFIQEDMNALVTAAQALSTALTRPPGED